MFAPLTFLMFSLIVSSGCTTTVLALRHAFHIPTKLHWRIASWALAALTVLAYWNLNWSPDGLDLLSIDPTTAIQYLIDQTKPRPDTFTISALIFVLIFPIAAFPLWYYASYCATKTAIDTIRFVRDFPDEYFWWTRK